MEVSLVESAGLPPDCLISVRAGTLRRQAPASADEFKLLFPGSAPFASSVKVDLLAPLGSAALELLPGTEQYPVEVGLGPGGAAMRLTLGIRQATLPPAVGGAAALAAGQRAAPSPPPLGAEPAPGSRQRMALEARAYLDEHHLLSWLQDLMQALVEEKPDDPWAYIMAVIARETGRFQMPEPSKKAPASAAGSDATATTAATSGSARGGDRAAAAHSARDSSASSAIGSPFLAGGAEEAAAEMQAPCRTPADAGGVHALRLKLRTSLAQAVECGELARLVAECGHGEEAADADASGDSVRTPRRQLDLDDEDDDIVVAKGPASPMGQLKGAIVEAAADGRLCNGLASGSSTPKVGDASVPSVTVIGITGALTELPAAGAELPVSGVSSARSEWSTTSSQADERMEPIRVRPGACMMSPTMISSVSLFGSPQTGHRSSVSTLGLSPETTGHSLLGSPAPAPGRELATSPEPRRSAASGLAPGEEAARRTFCFLESGEAEAGGTETVAALEATRFMADAVEAAAEAAEPARAAEPANADEVSAAIRIQSLQRARVSRKQTRRQLDEETSAATRIQAVQRGKASRIQSRKQLEEEAAAATRIQSVHRGKISRSQAKQQVEEEAQAAVRIQAMHRGAAARSQLRTQLTGAAEAAREEKQAGAAPSDRPAAKEEGVKPRSAPRVLPPKLDLRPVSREMRELATRAALESMTATPKAARGRRSAGGSGAATPLRALSKRRHAAASGKQSPTAIAPEVAERPLPPAVPCPKAARPEPPRKVLPPTSTAAGARASAGAAVVALAQQAPLRSPSAPSLRMPALKPLAPSAVGGHESAKAPEAMQRSTSLPRVPGTDGGASGGLSQLEALEARLRERSEKVRQDNSALRQENTRLRQMRESDGKAWDMHRENERLRAELGKLLSFSRR